MHQKQITIVLGIVKNENGCYLLGKRNEPSSPPIHEKWNILGGKIEFGETPEQAVVREIKEESGLDVKVVRLLPQIFVRQRQRHKIPIQVIGIPYECEIIGGKLFDQVTDKGVSELKFVHPKELENHELIEGEAEFFKLILEDSKSVFAHQF